MLMSSIRGCFQKCDAWQEWVDGRIAESLWLSELLLDRSKTSKGVLNMAQCLNFVPEHDKQSCVALKTHFSRMKGAIGILGGLLSRHR